MFLYITWTTSLENVCIVQNAMIMAEMIFWPLFKKTSSKALSLFVSTCFKRLSKGPPEILPCELLHVLKKSCPDRN